jgi:hypothetical protein
MTRGIETIYKDPAGPTADELSAAIAVDISKLDRRVILGLIPSANIAPCRRRRELDCLMGWGRKPAGHGCTGYQHEANE